MIFSDTKVNGIKKEFRSLEKTMKNLGFIRWSWDIHHLVYDRKYTVDGVDYYLRVPGKVVNEKQLEHPKALIELDEPIFARHFFPHGLDNEAEVPEAIHQEIEQKLSELEKALSE